MTEWLIVPVLKTGVPFYGTGGSNPSPSASSERSHRGLVQLTANELSPLPGSVGSNPTLSAKNHISKNQSKNYDYNNLWLNKIHGSNEGSRESSQ